MMAASQGGSRYLKQPFDYAHELRFETTERIMAMQFTTVERRLERIEEMIGSVERRLWVMVFGVVGVILTEGVQSILSYVPR
ncbi:MAG: hypothetical protein N2422_02375 [Rhodobacteraceae bacterium]|nr:hypothetical protein [Paracoccaceae bacterium]